MMPRMEAKKVEVPGTNLATVQKNDEDAVEKARKIGEDDWLEVRRRAEFDMVMDVYRPGRRASTECS